MPEGQLDNSEKEKQVEALHIIPFLSSLKFKLSELETRA